MSVADEAFREKVCKPYPGEHRLPYLLSDFHIVGATPAYGPGKGGWLILFVYLLIFLNNNSSWVLAIWENFNKGKKNYRESMNIEVNSDTINSTEIYHQMIHFFQEFSF